MNICEYKYMTLAVIAQESADISHINIASGQGLIQDKLLNSVSLCHTAKLGTPQNTCYVNTHTTVLGYQRG